jgi:hypothetical protein
MSVADILGTPIRDTTEPPPSFASPCTAPALPTTAQPRDLPGRSRLWLAVGVAAALTIGVAGGWFAGRGSGGPLPVATAVVEPVPAPVAAAAELFTALYLSGTTPPDSLALLYHGEAPPASEAWVNTTAAIAGVATSADTWEVTVAVDLLESSDGRYAPTPLAYFVVPISTAAGQPVATAAPARIPPPAAPPQVVPLLADVAPDQAAAATAFVEQYLSGGHDVGRYLTSPTAVEVFRAAPYESVSATVAGADSLGRVLVAATAETPSGTTHRLEYLLTLSLDTGVWSVSHLAAADI